jgi:hypothetical protein
MQLLRALLARRQLPATWSLDGVTPPPSQLHRNICSLSPRSAVCCCHLLEMGATTNSVPPLVGTRQPPDQLLISLQRARRLPTDAALHCKMLSCVARRRTAPSRPPPLLLLLLPPLVQLRQLPPARFASPFLTTLLDTTSDRRSRRMRSRRSSRPAKSGLAYAAESVATTQLGCADPTCRRTSWLTQQPLTDCCKRESPVFWRAAAVQSAAKTVLQLVLPGCRHDGGAVACNWLL